MARLLFRGDLLTARPSAAGRIARVLTAQVPAAYPANLNDLTSLYADVETIEGDPRPAGGRFRVDSSGRLPRFFGSDGVTTLFVLYDDGPPYTAVTITGVPDPADGSATFTSVAGSQQNGTRLVPVTTRSAVLNGLSNGTDTGSNMITRHVVITGASEVRLVYGNYHGADNNPAAPNAITVAAGSQDQQSGWIYRVTFDGAASMTLQPGQMVVSDPVPFDAVVGNVIFVHTYVTVASAGMKWPIGLSAQYSGEGWDSSASNSDKSLTNGSPGAAGQGYSPLAVVGRPVPATTATPVVGLVGDSLLYGQGESVTDMGFGVRALASAFGYFHLAIPGERASSLSASPSTYSVRASLLASCTHAICEYGANDLVAGLSLATVQANLVACWKKAWLRGVRTWQTTITPYTTSTDSWATVANQTPYAAEAVRTALNDWIRDGAPLNASTKVAVATGTVGALRAGTAGHYLTGYFEIADLAESARNSGKWKASYTTEGVHPNTTAATAMAAGVVTANFVAV